mgnify:CR=1 FL=1
MIGAAAQQNQLTPTKQNENADVQTDSMLQFSDILIQTPFIQSLLYSTTINCLRVDVGFDVDTSKPFLNELACFPDASLGLNASYHNIGQKMGQLLGTEAYVSRRDEWKEDGVI